MSRHVGNKFEKEVAQVVGATKTANSGAMFNDGDLQTKTFVLECKFTSKNTETISIKKDYIEHISKQAEMLNKEWAIVLGNPSHEGYVLISLDTFATLIDNYER